MIYHEIGNNNLPNDDGTISWIIHPYSDNHLSKIKNYLDDVDFNYREEDGILHINEDDKNLLILSSKQIMNHEDHREASIVIPLWTKKSYDELVRLRQEYAEKINNFKNNTIVNHSFDNVSDI